MEVVAFKLWSMAAVIVMSLLGGFLPLRLHSMDKSTRSAVTEFSRFFTGGVFLGVGMLHMLPESAENLEALGVSKLWGRKFPLAYFTCALGVVIIWFLERHTFRDRSQIMAVAAKAPEQGGAAICFVHVQPVTSYGLHLSHQAEPALVLPVSHQDIDQTAYAPLPGAPPLLLPAPLPPLHPPPSEQKGGEFPPRPLRSTRSEITHQQLLAPVLGCECPGAGEDLFSHAMERSHRHGGRKRPGLYAENRGIYQEISQEKASGIRRKGREKSPENRPKSPENRPKSPEIGENSPENRESIPGNSDALHEHAHTARHHHLLLPDGGNTALLLASLFSLHSFVVGAAFGTSREIDQSSISLLIALLAHKWAEAFAVGVQFVVEDVAINTTVPVVLLYVAMTPLGVVAGMLEWLVQGQRGLIAENVTQAFGAGTVLYITMMQLGSSENQDSLTNRWLQLSLFLLGLGVMTAVAFAF